MAQVTYARNSPYGKTQFYGNFLDLANFPDIPKNADDVIFEINRTYQYRPDLLAYDLYGDANLWWVFALRNPNSVRDPIFDMRIGSKIYLPKKSTLTGIIG
jgi:hypothetical protein